MIFIMTISCFGSFQTERVQSLRAGGQNCGILFKISRSLFSNLPLIDNNKGRICAGYRRLLRALLCDKVFSHFFERIFYKNNLWVVFLRKTSVFRVVFLRKKQYLFHFFSLSSIMKLATIRALQALDSTTGETHCRNERLIFCPIAPSTRRALCRRAARFGRMTRQRVHNQSFAFPFLKYFYVPKVSIFSKQISINHS